MLKKLRGSVLKQQGTWRNILMKISLRNKIPLRAHDTLKAMRNFNDDLMAMV